MQSRALSKTTLVIAIFLSLIISIAYAYPHSKEPEQPILAHCLLRGTTNAKGLKGVVTFTQSHGITKVNWSLDKTTVPAELQGKLLGFHIHEFGYIADATSTGGHYNPFGKNHSLPKEHAHQIHVGDLGNIDLSKGYQGSIKTKLLKFSGSISIIGRAIRLHMAADNGKAFQPTGNAGAPAAHCVIGIFNNATNTNTLNDRYSGSTAVAVLQKTSVSTSHVTGRVLFTYNSVSQKTRIQGKICGLPPASTHGMHIHTFGEIDLNDGLRTGGHFNPFGKNHGHPTSSERHVGDLGNIVADANGIASFDFLVDLIEITKSVRSIIGRGLVIHTNMDDGNPSTPTGNAGGRIAVAVIGIPPNTASLTNPNDACVDPAPPATIVVTPPPPQPQPGGGVEDDEQCNSQSSYHRYKSATADLYTFQDDHMYGGESDDHESTEDDENEEE